jgi:Mat/Ecp fimbriae outer membrane usher protein
MITSRPSKPLAALLLALSCTVLATITRIPAAAKENTGPIFTTEAPEGFANLTESQVLLVDVYFGGVRRGEAQIRFSPGSVTLLDAAATVALLPDVGDATSLISALSVAGLPPNAELVCGKTSDRSRCGRLNPDVAGVIFDRDRFRLDIFVNPRLLDVQRGNSDIYLPDPQGGIAVINSVGAVLSGQSQTSARYYNFQNSLVIADGERRLRADLAYGSKLGFGAERVAFEWDRPELRYLAGALWAPGSEIAGRRKLIGLGIESQIDTRLDKDELRGSPVVVYLERRARIDVLRDGRILHSAVYEAGNQQIDSSSLPDGSYDIVLRIEEPGSAVREERRFYTKSRRIPQKGRTDFYAYGGMLVKDFDHGSIEPSGRPYFQGGVMRRLTETWAIGGNVEASDHGGSVELGATWITPLMHLRAAAVIDFDGTYGGIVQVSQSGTSRLNFNFDLRRIKGQDTYPEAIHRYGSFSIGGFEGGYSQIGGVVSYSLAHLRVLGTFLYRDDDNQRARYSVGPSLEWDILRKGPLMLTMRGDMTATERGEAAFVGIALRLLGNDNLLTARGGARASSLAEDSLSDGLVTAFSGAWSPSVAGGELALGAGFEHHPKQESAVLSADYRHPFGTVAGDLVHSERTLSKTTLYSLGFQSTMAAGAGVVQAAGRTSAESLVVIRVNGARANDSFEVLVNEQTAGTVEGASPLTLTLPAYRAYEVRIRPTGAELVAYDSSSRKIGLYPGSVARLDWVSTPISIKVGRLIDAQGKPLAGATLSGRGAWAETGADGDFQIEAADNSPLLVTTSDGRTYILTLPAGDPKAGIARLGTIECCEGETIRLGVLEPSAERRNGGTK